MFLLGLITWTRCIKKYSCLSLQHILATSSNSLLTDKHMELNDFLKLYWNAQFVRMEAIDTVEFLVSPFVLLEYYNISAWY